MSNKPAINMSKVAAIQMCSSHLLDENLEIASELLNEAAQNGAELIVLPEMFAIFGLNSNDKLKFKEPFGNGKIQTFLSSKSKENKVWIIGGTIPLETVDDRKTRASSLIFNHKGNCVGRYDKIHLFDATIKNETYWESDSTESGDKVIVVDSPFGKIGMAVCYDIRFPELFRCLSEKGAEILILPSAFTYETGESHWEVLTRSRAIENFCYLIGSCQGGTHSNGRRTYGNSLIVSPWGEILARKNDTNSGIIYGTIDLEKIYEARNFIPFQKHRRIFHSSYIVNKSDE